MSTRQPALVLAGLLFAVVAGTAPAATNDSVALKGDAIRGKDIYARCGACHALEYDRTGPRHCGLFGRRAGSVPGFSYSAAMRKSNIVWDGKSLDRFIANPTKMMPGTAMGYAGISDPQERADLIAYLKQANASAECSETVQPESN
ncbi:MAG TPA: cytochrome c family protein [Moraxellaceae bacterium]|nr:cytochrome c family protein [Moraxellaceae bacterium]